MEKIKIAICDDEIIFAKRLEFLVASYCSEKELPFLIDIYESGKEFVDLEVKMAEYQIVFLDMNMENMDGIETARRLRNICQDTFIVFVTAFIKYTIEGFKVEPIRYILKTDNNYEKSVYESLDAICKKMDYQSHIREIQFREGSKKISLEKIMYIESDLHQVIFYILENKIITYTMYEKLNNIPNLLTDDFIRIHQSYIVNMKYISKITRTHVILLGGTELPVARSKEKEVKNKFAIYKGDL